MAKENPAAVEGRRALRPLAAAALLGLTAGAALAECPGRGCPAISFDLGLGDCPGPACPAFASTLSDQQSYVEMFGALQSGSDAPRPMEGRLLLQVPPPEVFQTRTLNDPFVHAGQGTSGSGHSMVTDDDDSPADWRPEFRAACADLLAIGVERLEVIGLPVGDADSQTAAVTFADWLTADCAKLCDGPGCVQITARQAGPSDALSDDFDLRPGTMLLELRAVP